MAMVIVNSALRQNDVIRIVENVELDNIKIFKYVAKEGIRIFFQCNYDDVDRACFTAYLAIFNTKLGKALYYNVVDIKEYPWVKCPKY